MILRDATCEDLSHILPLLEELGYPTTLESLEMRYERFLKNPGNGIVVCAKKKALNNLALSQKVSQKGHEHKEVKPKECPSLKSTKQDEIEILGLVAWSKSHLIISDVTRFHIEALVVSSDYRRQGIAKLLLRYVEDVARHFCPSVIDLTSGRRRAENGTHAFYERLGYANEGQMAKIYLRKEFTK